MYRRTTNTIQYPLGITLLINSSNTLIGIDFHVTQDLNNSNQIRLINSSLSEIFEPHNTTVISYK